MFLFRRSDLFALDIGSSSLKLVELKKTAKGYELTRAGILHLPPETIVEGTIMDSSALTESIKKLVQAHKPRTKNVATAVSGHSVIVKKISLPAMSEEEIEHSIQWEAEQYIPFNVNEVNLDFQLIQGTAAQSEDSGQMEVLLVAAKKELIEDYRTILEGAGLRPVVIDVASFAIQNMYETNYDCEEGEVVAMFNIGASSTNINMFRNGSSLFTRDIHFGGNQFNEEIQRALHVSYEEAEVLKLGSSSQAERHKAEVKAIMDRVTEALMAEVQRSLEFFSATSGDEKIHRVVLSGGCSLLAGLAQKMEGRLGLPVEVANPFRRIVYDEARIAPDFFEGIGPQLGVAVGLGIRRVGD